MRISPGVFFKIFILWVVREGGRGVKGQYDFHVWYSRSFFIFFKNFDFLGCKGGKRAKLARNDKKLSVVLDISGTIHHMIIICGTQV